MNSGARKDSHGENRRKDGYHYEDVAARFYSGLRYEILERNWQDSHREIDLIVQNDSKLIFIEVKGGRPEFMGHPAHRVDKRKKRLLLQAAQSYLLAHDPGMRDVQFDVLIVLRTDAGEKIERLENAITMDDAAN